MNGRVSATVTDAEPAARARNPHRRVSGRLANNQAPTQSAIAAKPMPPTQIELSNDDAAVTPSAAIASQPPPLATRSISRHARIADEADARCWGTHADWFSQAPMSAPRGMIAPAPSSPDDPISSGRNEPGSESSAAATMPMVRPPSPITRPMISSSEAKAVKPVIAASALQPFTCRPPASMAAPVCQR